MDTTGMNEVFTLAELHVLATAENASGVKSLTMKTRLDDIFSDSLEMLDFFLFLKERGEISEQDFTKAETLGDLANALVLSS